MCEKVEEEKNNRVILAVFTCYDHILIVGNKLGTEDTIGMTSDVVHTKQTRLHLKHQ